MSVAIEDGAIDWWNTKLIINHMSFTHQQCVTETIGNVGGRNPINPTHGGPVISALWST